MCIRDSAGVGKTSLAATLKPLGKGLIVSGEAGLKSLYGQGLDVFEFKSIDDLNVFINTLVTGNLDEYDWFFIDSITEIARLFEEKHKKILLDLIDHIPNNPLGKISKTDWNLPKKFERK